MIRNTIDAMIKISKISYLLRKLLFLAKYYKNIAITSSTAQGGGGSFNNRKPIGEVGCCESRTAERSH